MNLTLPATVNNVPGVLSWNFSDPGICITASSGSFTVRVGSNNPVAGSVGLNLGLAAGSALGRVEFFNQGAAAVNITVGPYGSARQNAIGAAVATFVASTAQIYDVGSVVSPLGITFAGVDSQGRHRKAIYVTNFGFTVAGGSASTALAVIQVAGFASMAAFPQLQPVPLETDADVIVIGVNQNLNGQPAHLQVGVTEIFYSKPLQPDV